MKPARVDAIRAHPTAVVACATTWPEFPALWPRLLDEVWQAVRADASVSPGRNVMLYLDDVPHVEVGVEVDAPFTTTGRVVASELPRGRAVTAQAASIEELDAAHRSLVDACAEHGLERLGPRWEVYGHERGGAPVAVDVFYLVR